jgi:glucan phosphorylase
MNQSTKTSLDSRSQNFVADDDRTGLTVEILKRAFAENLFYVQGKFPAIATKNDFYMALAYTVRDRQLQRWINTIETYLKQKNLKSSVIYLRSFYLGRAWETAWSISASGMKCVRLSRNPDWI